MRARTTNLAKPYLSQNDPQTAPTRRPRVGVGMTIGGPLLRSQRQITRVATLALFALLVGCGGANVQSDTNRGASAQSTLPDSVLLHGTWLLDVDASNELMDEDFHFDDAPGAYAGQVRFGVDQIFEMQLRAPNGERVTERLNFYVHNESDSFVYMNLLSPDDANQDRFESLIAEIIDHDTMILRDHHGSDVAFYFRRDSGPPASLVSAPYHFLTSDVIGTFDVDEHASLLSIMGLTELPEGMTPPPMSGTISFTNDGRYAMHMVAGDATLDDEGVYNVLFYHQNYVFLGLASTVPGMGSDDYHLELVFDGPDRFEFIDEPGQGGVIFQRR